MRKVQFRVVPGTLISSLLLKLMLIVLVAVALISYLGGIGQAQMGPSNGIEGDTSPTWSPTGELIAFVSTRNVKPEIYLVNRDGSRPTQLTTSPLGTGSSMPAWSPDGRRIAFVTGVLGAAQVFVMNTGGSEQRQLVSGRWNAKPQWSPDGRMLAFLSNRDGNEGVYVMTLDGVQGWSLSSELPSVASFSWSPDSKWIAFGTQKFEINRSDGNVVFRWESKIYTASVSGGQRNTLPAISSGPIELAWSPDGNHIALVSRHEGLGQIYVMNAIGGDQKRLTSDGYNHSPVWSPDGGRIAFVSHRDGADQIYVMNGDGTRQVRITRIGQSTQPAWSPDSRRIVYTSKRGGLWRIYSANTDGSEELPLTADQ